MVGSGRSLVDRSVVQGQEDSDDGLCDQKERNPFMVGDKVYLRPSSGKCDVEWTGPHIVTRINSSVSVVIDDDRISRHISHLRLVPGSRGEGIGEAARVGSASDGSGSAMSDDEIDDVRVGGVRRSSRVKSRPVW